MVATHEVDARVQHQIRVELIQVHVQRSAEVQGYRQRRDAPRGQAVQVGVREPLDIQIATADAVQRLVVLTSIYWCKKCTHIVSSLAVATHKPRTDVPDQIGQVPRLTAKAVTGRGTLCRARHVGVEALTKLAEALCRQFWCQPHSNHFCVCTSGYAKTPASRRTAAAA